MRTDLLDILACPLCRGRLTLQPGADADGVEIQSGVLTCLPCGARYPIADGIPNLLPPELRNSRPGGTAG